MDELGLRIKSLGLTYFFVTFLFCASNFKTSHAGGSNHWRHKKAFPKPGLLDGGIGQDGWNMAELMANSEDVWSEKVMSVAGTPAPQGRSSHNTFNVLDYGAIGDGQKDDTKAFEATWAAACKVEASSVLVPSGSIFLVGPISFSGVYCAPNIVFQLDGKIIAPTSAQHWGKGLLQWIEFTKLQGITIQGGGTIDGQGSVWWTGNKMPSTKPTALRFYGSTDATVTGITIQNSPRSHLKFDSCNAVEVFHITVSSPSTSPNTDGIHLENSQNVLVYNSNLACGDDCISIQTGSSNVYIHDVNCGPGHGISIGGLGPDKTKACVSNITIRDTTMTNTLAGVRIKTWQGGSGSVKEVTFSNIQVLGVKTPIVIDQFYCSNKPSGKCKNDSSAVAISGVNYANIQGTYITNPVHFACSDNWPCTGISLDTIDLTPEGEGAQPFCWNTYGELKTTTIPPIDCLKTGSSKKLVIDC